MNKQILTILCITLFHMSVTAQEVKTIVVEPVGVYAEIDVAGQNRMISQLYDLKTRNASIDTIFNNFTRYIPPVMYLFSQALFLNGEKQSAVEWYLYAQIQAMYDAARCTDNSAKQAVLILEERNRPVLNEYMNENKKLVTETAGKVMLLFKKVQTEYDIRWINLHGMGSFSGAFGEELPKETPKLTVDKSLWPDIADNILKEFAARYSVNDK